MARRGAKSGNGLEIDRPALDALGPALELLHLSRERRRDSLKKPLKIAVAHFGIIRSLEHTIASIEKNVLGPARRTGDVKIFAHLYDQTTIDNPRSGEFGRLDTGAAMRMKIDDLQQEKPSACSRVWDIERFKAWGDSWDDDFRSLSNLVHQLHSLDRVTDRVLDYQPDICIFARPDLRYIDSLGKALKLAAKTETPHIYVPSWQSFGALNDRFAICREPEAIRAYGKRIHLAEHFFQTYQTPIHSERFLAFAINSAAIPVTPISARASRVRIDGSIPGADQFPNLPKRVGRKTMEFLGLWNLAQRLRGRPTR